MIDDYFRVRVRSAGGRPLPYRWHWRPSPFSDYDLWLCRGGHAELTTTDGTVAFSRGGCLLLQPGAHYRIDGNDRSDGPQLDHYFVHFEFIDSRGAPRPPTEDESLILHRQLRDLAFMEAAIGQVVACWDYDDKKAGVEASAWLRSVLIALKRHDEVSALRGRDLAHYERIEAICQEIQAAPALPHRVHDLAERHFYSPEHLTRVFKQFKGVSPGEFVIRTRLDAARELLLGSSLTIGEIARILGYRDIYFFSKQFRQRVGVPPSQYRRREPTKLSPS